MNKTGRILELAIVLATAAVIAGAAHMWATGGINP